MSKKQKKLTNLKQASQSPNILEEDDKQILSGKKPKIEFKTSAQEAL